MSNNPLCPRLMAIWSELMDHRLRPVHAFTDAIGLTDAVRRNLHSFVSGASDYANNFDAPCEVVSDYDVILNPNWRARPVMKTLVPHRNIENLLGVMEFHNSISSQRDTRFKVIDGWSLCMIRNKINFPPVTQHRSLEIKIRHDETGQIGMISHVMAHSRDAYAQSALHLEEYRSAKAAMGRVSEQLIDIKTDLESSVRDQAIRFLRQDYGRLEDEMASAIRQCAIINYQDACTDMGGRKLNDLVTEFENTSYYNMGELIAQAKGREPTPFRQVA